MKYVGSKQRIADKLSPIIQRGRRTDQCIVETFAGGLNMTAKLTGFRIANDINPYVIALWRALLFENFQPPKYVAKDMYSHIRENKHLYSEAVVGWVGINCSFKGKFFGGFAGTHKNGRNYQEEAINNTLKQKPYLTGITLTQGDYRDLRIPKNSIIYCDPPYLNTTGYGVKFDTEAFWKWCRSKVQEGHTVYVSEYEAPEDFISIWNQPLRNNLLNTNTRENRNENLFIYNDII